ncbi:MAG: sulfatase-like hydrolase/transferase [Burkholderiales bacterium]|nr:sulfatase-like hydrolase/transferase [Burkholderiales bacterium]
MTDQHNAEFLSCYGHRVLATPHIDSIFERGVLFNRCYVAAPVCMPNRSSLMTGRMPSAHGVRINGIALSRSSTTFVDLLGAAGYRTALVGKSHLQNMMVDPPMVAPPESSPGCIRPPVELSEAHRPDGDSYEEELGSSFETGVVRRRTNYYGFDHTRLVTGHGDVAGGDYLLWLADKGKHYLNLRGEENALPSSVECPDAWRTAIPEELYPTTFIADEAIGYLKAQATARGDTPFFLMVSFPDPHHPFTPPGRYWSLYDPSDMKLPGNFHPDENSLPQVKHAHAALAANGKPTGGYGVTAVSERAAREAMALTCGMIRMIDDAVGRILAALSSTHASSETILVFTADHGDYLGDHGLLRKGPLHFQSVSRVPLIISSGNTGPRREKSGALVSTIDIPATLLDLAGLAPFNGMQGKPLTSILRGGAAEHRPEVLIEEDAQEIQLGWSVAPRVRSIISQRHRLTIYNASAQGELFDLAEDPLEMINLWNDETAAGVRADLVERLARVQMEMADTSPWPRSIA